MVGSMLLLKMLHCRRKLSKTHRRPVNNIRAGSSTQNVKIACKIKKEISTDETCRICLKDGKLPIFGGSSSNELCVSIYEIGAVEVCADDPYPKYLCQACHALLQGALMFRKTAQKSDIFLKKRKETLTKPEPVSDTDEPDGYHNDGDTYEVPIEPNVECVTEWYGDDDPKKANETAKNPEPISETDEPHGNIIDDVPIKRKVNCPKIWMCNRCGIQFNTYQEYNDHMLSDEHENKRVICHICKNTYTPHYLRRHMSIHKQETAHMCDVCGKKFTVKSLLTRHRLTHFYDLPFQCDLCPYRGRFTESLKMHMRSHTGERPYQCEQCPSRFINKSNLNKHTLTHKREHNFRCEVCGRGFYTKRELDLHLKVDHTGIREHVCGTCGKAFGYRKQMMKHELRVHKREKLKSGRMPIYLKVETMKRQLSNKPDDAVSEGPLPDGPTTL